MVRRRIYEKASESEADNLNDDTDDLPCRDRPSTGKDALDLPFVYEESGDSEDLDGWLATLPRQGSKIAISLLTREFPSTIIVTSARDAAHVSSTPHRLVHRTPILRSPTYLNPIHSSRWPSFPTTRQFHSTLPNYHTSQTNPPSSVFDH